MAALPLTTAAGRPLARLGGRAEPQEATATLPHPLLEEELSGPGSRAWLRGAGEKDLAWASSPVPSAGASRPQPDLDSPRSPGPSPALGTPSLNGALPSCLTTPQLCPQCPLSRSILLNRQAITALPADPWTMHGRPGSMGEWQLGPPLQLL